MSGDRGRRVGLLVFCAVWLGTLGWCLRALTSAPELTPEQLLGLIPIVYLAAWGPWLLLSRHSQTGRVARFTACTASVGVAIALVEATAALGVVDYRVTFSTPTPSWYRPGNRPDTELLYAREGSCTRRLRFTGADVAGLKGIRDRTVYECDLTLDSNGFRNPTDLTSADVIVLGDSFIEGLQVAAPELMTAQLSEILGTTVANLGRTGYGPQQELAVLRRYGLKLSPRTCVWAFYEGNDLQDVMSYAAESERATKAARRRPSRARDFYARCFTRNALAFFLRTGPTDSARRFTGWLATGSGAPESVYFSCGVHEGRETPRVFGDRQTAVGSFITVLRSAASECSGRGIDLVVVFVPTKFRVYGQFCEFDAGSPCRSWRTDDLPETIGAGVETVPGSIAFLDLTPVLRASAGKGARPYLRDDTHWSASGHRTAAEAIARLLSERVGRAAGRDAGISKWVLALPNRPSQNNSHSNHPRPAPAAIRRTRPPTSAR